MTWQMETSPTSCFTSSVYKYLLLVFFSNYSLEQGDHRINNEILHVPLEVPTYQGCKNPRGLTPDAEPVLP